MNKPTLTPTQRIFSFLRTVAVMSVAVLLASIAMDWYRKPDTPPRFAEQVLTTLDNQPKILAQLSHQQTAVLYFFGSWCHYCAVTSPTVEKLHQAGVPVLAIALKSGSAEEVQRYLAEEKLHFPVVNDPLGAYAKQWHIQAVPTIILIKNGQVQTHTTGLTSYWGLRARLALF